MDVPTIDNPIEYASRLEAADNNLTISERDIQGPGTGNWGDFYNGVANNGATERLDIQSDNIDVSSAARSTHRFVRFDGTAKNALVQGLYGCTSVIVIGHKGKFKRVLRVLKGAHTFVDLHSCLGAYISHFWEIPGFVVHTNDPRNPFAPNPNFNYDVLQYLQ